MALKTQWACHCRVWCIYFNGVIEMHTHLFRELPQVHRCLSPSSHHNGASAYLQDHVSYKTTFGQTLVSTVQEWMMRHNGKQQNLCLSCAPISLFTKIQAPAVLSHSEFSSLTNWDPCFKKWQQLHLPYCFHADYLRNASALPEKPTAQSLLKSGSSINSARANSRSRYTTPVSMENVVMT